MNRNEIIVIGSYNHDTAMTVARFPVPGETMKTLGLATSHGGKGSNQAVQAARFGVSVAMLACVGDDQIGSAAIAMWETEAIAADMVQRVVHRPTGTAMILVNAGGENLIIIDGGANDCLIADNVVLHSDKIAASRLVVGQLETPQQATIAAFRIARDAGVQTMLNAAPAPSDMSEELLRLTDILVVNEGEAIALNGGQDCIQDAKNAALWLLPRVAIGVLLTLGEKGATFFDRNGGQFSQSPAPASVVDTTGAGDALIGAFAAQLVSQGSVEEALALGVAAGTYACCRHGAVPSFGTKADIEKQLHGLHR